MSKKHIIRVEIDDWVEEYRLAEEQISGVDDILELLKNPDIKPQKAGRLVLAARELGEAPKDILPPNKAVLATGAARKIIEMSTDRMVKVTIDNGRDIQVREFIAPVKDSQEYSDNQILCVKGLVTYQDELAATRALEYLRKVIPGHVYDRLAIIAYSGGDVREAGEELKQKVDEIVEKLS